MSDLNDMNETVMAAREGCHDAFGDLVRATYNDTYSHALRLVGNVDDAHDVAQDTYLKAFRYLRGFRGESNIATWLYRITANSAHSLVAKRRRSETSPLTEEMVVSDDELAHDPLRQAELNDLRSRLVVALETLPTKLRAVLVLRDIYDQSHEAIARQLGITESAAKVRLHRARQKLRDQLFGDLTAEDAPEMSASIDATVQSVKTAKTVDDSKVSA
jgi:RNA polymerase sigma-70 factor, ECF subfamily